MIPHLHRTEHMERAILRLARELDALFYIEGGVGMYLTCEFTKFFRLVKVAENLRRLPPLSVANDQSIFQHQIGRSKRDACHQQAVITVYRNSYEYLQGLTVVLPAPNHKALSGH